MVCKHFTDGGSWGYKKWLHGFLHGRKVGKHWDRVMTFERKHLTIFYDFRLRGEFTVCKQHLPGPHTALKGYYTVYLLWQGEGRSITSVPYSSCKNVILNSMNTIYFDLVTLFFTTQRSFMICYLHLTVLGWFKWRTEFCLQSAKGRNLLGKPGSIAMHLLTVKLWRWEFDYIGTGQG